MRIRIIPTSTIGISTDAREIVLASTGRLEPREGLSITSRQFGNGLKRWLVAHSGIDPNSLAHYCSGDGSPDAPGADGIAERPKLGQG